MATQHPDNAGKPWWCESAFVSTQDEIEEMLILFDHLAIDEYMWDWEGKYVDESVGEKLFSRAEAYFAKRPLGDRLHLTYRIPAFDGQKMHRMARAFMNVLSLADLAKDIGLARPPVTEMFLPMTTSAEQPMQVRKTFTEIAGYHRAAFHHTHGEEGDLLESFDVTPLVEDVESLLSIESIVRPYWQSLVDAGKKNLRTRGQRIFMARSDPAMNAGLVPAVLAIKAALSTVNSVGRELGFPVHPVIGTGSLPFRGSVNPLYLDAFLEQYAGVRTYSIQSAFRYDYPKEQVDSALRQIKLEAPKRKAVEVSAPDAERIRTVCALFSDLWRPSIEPIAGLINQMAAYIPPRRERMQHIGLFGYSRGIGTVKLPRAIGFTAALYSLGVPPEFFTTGRGLQAAQAQGLLDTVETFYPALRADMQHAGKYLNRENLGLLAAKEPTFALVQEDIRLIESILGLELGPKEPRHIIHRNLTSTIYQRLCSGDPQKEDMQRDIIEAGVIRRSLG